MLLALLSGFSWEEKRRFSSTSFSHYFPWLSHLHHNFAASLSPSRLHLPSTPTFLTFLSLFPHCPRESAHAANSEMNLIFPAQITKTIVEKYLSKNPLWQASTNTEKLSHGDMAIGFEHISKDNN